MENSPHPEEPLLPLVLAQPEVYQLRKGLLAIQRNGVSQENLETYLPVSVSSRIDFTKGNVNLDAVVKQLLDALEDRLIVEIQVPLEPSVELLKRIRSWAHDLFMKPITLVIIPDKRIIAGAIISAEGRRYDESLISSILSHEKLSRLS